MFKKGIKITLLVVWGLATSAIMISLNSLHMASFFPSLEYAQPSDQRWALTHVLGKDCKCSHIVFEYLMKRGPRKDVKESVVLLGAMPLEKEELLKRGFLVQDKEARSLASEKAVGVPFLLVTTAKGEAVYAGGYAKATLNSTTQVRDLDILASLRDGKPASEFPIFGCAVSQRMQKLMDPLGFKYQEKDL